MDAPKMTTAYQQAFDRFVQDNGLDIDDAYWPEWAHVAWGEIVRRRWSAAPAGGES